MLLGGLNRQHLTKKSIEMKTEINRINFHRIKAAFRK